VSSGRAGDVSTYCEGQMSSVCQRKHMYCTVWFHNSLPHSLQSLNMKTNIKNPATCGMQSVKEFFKDKNV